MLGFAMSPAVAHLLLAAWLHLPCVAADAACAPAAYRALSQASGSVHVAHDAHLTGDAAENAESNDEDPVRKACASGHADVAPPHRLGVLALSDRLPGSSLTVAASHPPRGPPAR